MAKNVFFSFHYKPDNWRAAQVRTAGIVEGNQPVSDNDWEAITSRGEDAIKGWIDRQMSGRPCTVVLIGSATAGRKSITYEIEKAWNDGKGVVGIYIHHLKNRLGEQSTKGRNPFDDLTFSDSRMLSSVAKAHDPPYSTSTSAYEYITSSIDGWVDEAIRIRGRA